MDPKRRNFLALAGITPLALLAAHNAFAQDAACYSSEKLSLSQKTRRRSLGFLDVSPDPKRRCGGCSFFTGTSGNCGSCQMLSGGPVTNASTCGSFAPRAK